MNCRQYRDALHELADGTLGTVRRAELQTHLDQCDHCRALAADLQKIRRAAASLDPVAPPDRVWMQIAGRLRQEGRVHDVVQPRRPQTALLAIAAALLLAVGGSLYVLFPRDEAPAASVASGSPDPARPEATPAGGNAPDADPVQSITDDLAVAERHYQSAIDKLEVVARSNDGTLDPATAAIIQQNVQVINQAIAESRTALEAEPQSTPARDSLFEALRQKVTLLQNTIALMNEMRKGNSAGAAQIVDGANKS